MEKIRCKKCLHEWVSRIEHPMQCPRCKSYSWDIDLDNKLKKEDKQDGNNN